MTTTSPDEHTPTTKDVRDRWAWNDRDAIDLAEAILTAVNERDALLADRDRLSRIVEAVGAHCESERARIRAKYEHGVAYHQYANACDDILAILAGGQTT